MVQITVWSCVNVLASIKMQSESCDCSHSVESRPAGGAALRHGVPLGSRCHGCLVQFSFEFLRLTVPNGAQSTLSSSMLMYQRPGHSNGHALKFNANASRSRLSSHGCSFPTERSRYKSSFNVKSLALCVNLTAGRSQRSAVDISHSILSSGQ